MKQVTQIGGWLTGFEIENAIENQTIIIEPFFEGNLNPNSYNYHLGSTIKRITNEVIDMKGEEYFEEIIIPEKGYLLKPGECYLGTTYEIIGSDLYASLITGRSSVGRKFVTNHITAGLIDQGFIGNITLEITVIKPTIIYPLIQFGQIFWYTTVGKPKLYNGKYQNQLGPTISRLYLDK